MPLSVCGPWSRETFIEGSSTSWGPWTGCYEASNGCTYCYFYGSYIKRYGQNIIEKIDKFDWLVKGNVKRQYNIKGNRILATYFAIDFFLPGTDEWRKEVWTIVRERTDTDFLILIKCTDRFLIPLPPDWGTDYGNVDIGCTVENQRMAGYRLPLLLSHPIKRRLIVCVSLLEAIDLTSYPHGVDHVTVGGETKRDARVCDYDWVLDIREQYVKTDKTFRFRDIGSFLRYNGVVERINPFKQTGLTKELGVDISGGERLF